MKLNYLEEQYNLNSDSLKTTIALILQTAIHWKLQKICALQS